MTLTMHIGFDDTDSPRMGCTTYVAAIIVEKLQRLGVEFIDYPNLIRLNPDAPWKTRGNGALCLRITCSENTEDKVKEVVTNTVERHSDLEHKGTDPGIVFLSGNHIPKLIQRFSRDAITRIVNLKDAVNLAERFNAESVGFKRRRGIIGGLAAIGEPLGGDHTYEILAYRVPENWGTKREIDHSSVFEMDKATAPQTYNNVDLNRRRVIITPRGPDPILFGIRGETPDVVKRAFRMVRLNEPIERWVVFRTNQGTDAHLIKTDQIRNMTPYSHVIATGIVTSDPRTIQGRHTFFSIKDTSAQIQCAAYEPTGVLRKIACRLVTGDDVEVCGSVRPASEKHPLTINLERIRILRITPKILYRNPLCGKCGKRLKSMGTNKGFRCDRCKSRYPRLRKAEARMERDLQKGIYIASPGSQRHLTKPLRRYGLEKHGMHCKLTDDWSCISVQTSRHACA